MVVKYLFQSDKSLTSLVAKRGLAHCLRCRNACKIQNGPQGAKKWPTGSGKGSNPRSFDAPINFREIFSSDPRSCYMRKGCEKKEKNAEHFSPLTLLPVDHLNGDRLHR